MTTYTNVFGNTTLPPADYGYVAVTLSANTQFYWPQTSSGDDLVAKIMDFSAASIGLSALLPDATEVSVGEDVLVRNVGSNSFSVKSNDGTVLATVASGSATYLYLTDNTTVGGTWGNVAFGVGTSSTDAATLVGYGIMAIGSTLNQSHPIFETATGILIDSTHRSQVVNFTGGADTLDLTSAVTLGNNFFTVIRNSGSGTLDIVPNGVETIDGLVSFSIQPSESLILCCSGTGWVTVGYGRSVNFNFTQLVKDVTAGGTFTLSTSEAGNKLLTFVGTPGSAVTVVVPNVVSVYYVLNSCSTTQNVTVKTAAGTGTVVPQTQRIIAICDATNVYSAQSVQSNTSLSLTDGSVSLPSLNFASQTNTGLYKYGSNGIAVSVNGVLSLYADANGIGAPVGLTLPQGTSAAPTAEGKVYWQSTTDTLSVGDGAAAKEITSNTGTQTLTNKTLTSPDINGGAIDGATIGATTPAAATVTSLTDSGNLTFTGTGNRITGDFSNATVANRVMFQTSTAGGATRLGTIPNGAGTAGEFILHNNANTAASSYLSYGINTTEAYVESGHHGASYLPMAFYTGGLKQMDLSTSGGLGVGVGAGSFIRLRSKGFGTTSSTYGLYVENSSATDTFAVQDDGQAYSKGLSVNGASFGLGYGTGAGGEVTQGTSRTTGVTLSKPTGKIILFSKAATAGLVDSFTVTNTLVAATDVIQLSFQSCTVDATDIYIPVVSQVSAGSFRVSIYTPAATASEAPVLNFAIIKGATS
jgi:hypothetical protein